MVSAEASSSLGGCHPEVAEAVVDVTFKLLLLNDRGLDLEFVEEVTKILSDAVAGGERVVKCDGERLW